MTQSLPEGLTSDMLAAIGRYLAEQAAVKDTQFRPNGVLQPHQIRGVNSKYKYQYQEYPKALDPPKVLIRTEGEERTFRLRQSQPLPWSETPTVNGYYATRVYPFEMWPTQIVVHSKSEEDAKLAEWNLQTPEQLIYPRWLFHPMEQPKMVRGATEEEALGSGWYPTIKEATDAAEKLTFGDTAARQREALINEAKAANVDVNPAWGDKRIREAIDKVKKAA